MDKSEINEYLYKHIPITKALGAEAVAFSEREVAFSAPLANNINHRSSAFGGSISSLLITTCWAYLRLLFDDEPRVPRIVIAASSTQFLKPVLSDFTSTLVVPHAEEIENFKAVFAAKGKAKITLQSQIKENGALLARFEGVFVVLKAKTDSAEL